MIGVPPRSSVQSLQLPEARLVKRWKARFVLEGRILLFLPAINVHSIRIRIYKQ